jgi:hypothetical protein
MAERIDLVVIGGGQAGGHGLWLANQRCNLVQLRSFETGTTVKLRCIATVRADRRPGECRGDGPVD